MKTKWILYCGGALGQSLIYATLNSMVVAFYKNAVYARVVISVATVGALISFYKALEACLEPFAGRFVDKWGSARRAIIIFASGIVLAVATLVVFLPSSLARFAPPTVGLTLTLTVFAVGYAVFYVTHSSLLVDLAHSPSAKLRLSTQTATFGLVGTIAGLIAAPILASVYGFRLMAALVVGLAIVLLTTSSFAAVRIEATSHPEAGSKGGSIISTARAALRIQEFRALTFARASGGIATNMTVLGLPLLPPIFGRALSFSGAVNAVMMSACLVGFFLVRHVARRLGTGWVLVASMMTMGLGIGGVGLAAWSLKLWLLWLSVTMIGAGLAGYFALPNAFLAEIVANDRHSDRQSREAALYGIHFFLVNIGKSLAGLFAGAALSITASAHGLDQPLGLFAVAGVFACLSGAALWITAKWNWFERSRLWNQKGPTAETSNTVLERE